MATEYLDYSDLPMTTATANTTYVLDDASNRYINSGYMFDLDATEGLTFELGGALYSEDSIFRYGQQGQPAPAIQVHIGATGFMRGGSAGFMIAGDGSLFHNDGMVAAGEGQAVEMDGDHITLENTGVLTTMGGNGVSLQGSDLRLENSGTINGTVHMYSDAGSTSTLVNKGQLNSSSSAISSGQGDDSVINFGQIRSNINMGLGEDRFIDKGGHVSGAIQGGGDDDLYVIKSADYDLRESAGGGFDTVKTFVSWTLDQEFESGRLMGKGNINLTGNQGGEFLYGNAGNNKIDGASGADWLDGGHGRDRLTGGSDADHFVFHAGGGKDVITDFEDGSDQIVLQTYKGIDSFKDIAVKQSGDDLVVKLLGGDEITIHNMHKADLTAGDFAF